MIRKPSELSSFISETFSFTCLLVYLSTIKDLKSAARTAASETTATKETATETTETATTAATTTASEGEYERRYATGSVYMGIVCGFVVLFFMPTLFAAPLGAGVIPVLDAQN